MRGGTSYFARYVPTGHLVYGDGDSLFAVAVDPQRFNPLGAPVPVIQGIHNYYGLYSSVALSDAGTVAYLPADHVEEAGFVWVNRAGNAVPIPGARGNIFSLFRLSPDGHAVGVTLGQAAQSSVWIFDLERGTRRLLAEADSYGSVWSGDGSSLTYAARRDGTQGLFRKRADGTGNEERLVVRHSASYPSDWSPDNQSLLFEESSTRGGFEVWVYSGGAPSLFLAGTFDQQYPMFSSDGRFLAYQSGEPNDENVYVQPYPGPGARIAVSSESGGATPRWAPNGRDLYYSSGTKMMAVTVEREPVLRAGQPRVVFDGIVGRRFDISPDGKRFLMVSPRTTAVPLEVRVILNWQQELERLAPHARR
jgi:Tol biopolymer transport system component